MPAPGEPAFHGMAGPGRSAMRRSMVWLGRSMVWLGSWAGACEPDREHAAPLGTLELEGGGDGGCESHPSR